MNCICINLFSHFIWLKCAVCWCLCTSVLYNLDSVVNRDQNSILALPQITGKHKEREKTHLPFIWNIKCCSIQYMNRNMKLAHSRWWLSVSGGRALPVGFSSPCMANICFCFLEWSQPCKVVNYPVEGFMGWFISLCRHFKCSILIFSHAE